MPHALADRIRRHQVRFAHRLTTLPPSQRNRLGVIISIVLVAIVAFAIASYWVSGRPVVRSIAVLPFISASSFDYDHVTHGIGSHLATRLSGIDGILVKPYRDLPRGTPGELPMMLNVEAVLVGMVTVEAGTITVEVEQIHRGGEILPLARIESASYGDALQLLTAAVAPRLKRRLSDREWAWLLWRPEEVVRE